MTLRNKFRDFLPILVVFILVNSMAVGLRAQWRDWNVDQDLLIAGNLFLFAVTAGSFLIAKKGLQHENPHAFVRAVFSSILIKLFITVIAAFIYISVYKKDLNKPAFFSLMALYLVYTFIEASVLSRMLRRKPDE